LSSSQPGRGRHSSVAASRSRRRSARRRPSNHRRWSLGLALVLVALTAAVGLVWRQETQERPDAVLSPVNSDGDSTAPPATDVAARSAAVDRVLVRRARAVLRKNLAEFVADVDPADRELLAEQQVLFRNLVQFGFTRLSYHQKRAHFDQALVEQHGPTTYSVQVVMVYQISGINPVPVRSLVGYVFTQRADGRWVLTDDDDFDVTLPRGSHQEAWDSGPVLVRRAPRVLVVVEQNATALATTLLAKATHAVKAVTKRWPGGWTGAGVVIALDDKIVRGADYSVPKNAEDALAMATWVYRTLPGDVTTEGDRADSYVVVNPRNRERLDARILAHEFTHVAAAKYGPDAPRWLIEGVATYVEYLPMDGEPDLALDAFREKMRVKYLAGAERLPTDTGFLENSGSSYPLSWLAVDYLFTRFGPTELGTLYQELAALGFSQNARNRIMIEHVGMTETGLFDALRAAA